MTVFQPCGSVLKEPVYETLVSLIDELTQLDEILSLFNASEKAIISGANYISFICKISHEAGHYMK